MGLREPQSPGPEKQPGRGAGCFAGTGLLLRRNCSLPHCGNWKLQEDSQQIHPGVTAGSTGAARATEVPSGSPRPIPIVASTDFLAPCKALQCGRGSAPRFAGKLGCRCLDTCIMRLPFRVPGVGSGLSSQTPGLPGKDPGARLWLALHRDRTAIT